MSDPRDISFGTFNLYNLQLPDTSWRHNANPYSQPEYDAKISWTSDMLRKLDCDVIAFQELWSEQCLVDAFDAAGLSGRYDLAYISDPGQGWYDIAVAAAVRDPWEIRNKRIHKAFPPGYRLLKRGGAVRDPEDDEIEVSIDKFSRSVIELEIGHKDRPDLSTIRVLCAHLKSKLTTRLDKEEREQDAVAANAQALGAAISTIRRTAEAAALRVIITDIIKSSDTPLVVLGDLNDGHLSNTLSILTAQPSYRPHFKSRTGGRSDAGLYAASRLEEYRSMRDVNYTHEFNAVKEILDHALVSEQFYDHSRSRLWSFKEMVIWKDHIEDGDKATGDHGVVAARFLYDPAD